MLFRTALSHCTRSGRAVSTIPPILTVTFGQYRHAYGRTYIIPTTICRANKTNASSSSSSRSSRTSDGAKKKSKASIKLMSRGKASSKSPGKTKVGRPKSTTQRGIKTIVKSTTVTNTKKKKPISQPKKSTIHFPVGPSKAINFFHREFIANRKLSNLEEGQQAMKESSAAWLQLNSIEKAKYEMLAEQDKIRYKTEIQTLRSQLSPIEISRERKVQQYRRSLGLPLSRHSKLITKISRSSSSSSSTMGAGTAPFPQFTRAVWNGSVDEAVKICGSEWKDATFSERGILLGKVWKSMSESDKAKYVSK